MNPDPSRRGVALVALVAEDEPLYRMQTADLLGEAGFEVIEVANAASALEHFEAHDGIALLFTDIWMPGRMDGLALAHEVERRWPHTQIVVCSGVQGLDHSALPEKAVFFDKPYQPEAVTAAIARAMGDSA